MGAMAAILVGAATALQCMPSAVSIMLRYRSGVYGSLRDKRFQTLRSNQDCTTLLFGSSIWGLLFTGMFCWFVVSALTFVFVCDVSN
jgi:hypothetical protein